MTTSNKACTIWFTGLPSSGKSTLAEMLESEFKRLGYPVEILDGDVVRTNLSKGLGFSKEHRNINIRRIGFVCHLLSRNGTFAISAAISPYRNVRDENRSMIGDFVEVFVNCPLEECVKRDVKGLYKKAVAGEIHEFTGISDPYEEPLNPEVMVETAMEEPDESLEKILNKLAEIGYISRDRQNGSTQAYTQQEEVLVKSA